MSRFETAANRYEEFSSTGQAGMGGISQPLAPWQGMTASASVSPPVWSQGLFGDCCTGLAYQIMPCCCGTPAAVRRVSTHLSRYGAHPTCHACCPYCPECQPRHTSRFGKSESVKGEIAAGSWLCYCLCPPCYIRSNRELFEQQHNLPGDCCGDCAIGWCCWGCGLRQMEAYAAEEEARELERHRIAREQSMRAWGSPRSHPQQQGSFLGAVAGRIMRV